MNTRHANFKDETGKKYGKLTVVSFAYTQNTGHAGRYACWNCLCDCGNKFVVVGYRLRTGVTKSCGCAKADVGISRIKPVYEIFKEANE